MFSIPQGKSKSNLNLAEAGSQAPDISRSLGGPDDESLMKKGLRLSGVASPAIFQEPSQWGCWREPIKVQNAKCCLEHTYT